MIMIMNLMIFWSLGSLNELVLILADSHHHGIHEDMENSSHVMHDIENSSHVIHDMERLDDDGVLNDGHYYLVGENDI